MKKKENSQKLDPSELKAMKAFSYIRDAIQKKPSRQNHVKGNKFGSQAASNVRADI